MLGWLNDITGSGEKFRDLQVQEREWINGQIGEIRQAAGYHEAKLSGLREQIESRIQELIRTKVDTVRESIEQSIVGLER